MKNLWKAALFATGKGDMFAENGKGPAGTVQEKLQNGIGKMLECPNFCEPNGGIWELERVKRSNALNIVTMGQTRTIFDARFENLYFVVAKCPIKYSVLLL